MGWTMATAEDVHNDTTTKESNDNKPFPVTIVVDFIIAIITSFWHATRTHKNETVFNHGKTVKQPSISHCHCSLLSIKPPHIDWDFKIYVNRNRVTVKLPQSKISANFDSAFLVKWIWCASFAEYQLVWMLSRKKWISSYQNPPVHFRRHTKCFNNRVFLRFIEL